jgi:hypothetical protein
MFAVATQIRPENCVPNSNLTGSGAGALMGGSSGNGLGQDRSAPAILLPGPFGDNPNGAVCGNADCTVVIVTAPTTKKPFYFNGMAWVSNPHYVQPWYAPYAEYGFVFGPPALAAGAVALPEAAIAARTAAMNPSSKLFARGTGFFQRNNVVRLGQGWKGSADAGSRVFRIVIGYRTWPKIPGLPTFPWHVP